MWISGYENLREKQCDIAIPTVPFPIDPGRHDEPHQQASSSSNSTTLSNRWRIVLQPFEHWVKPIELKVVGTVAVLQLVLDAFLG